MLQPVPANGCRITVFIIAEILNLFFARQADVRIKPYTLPDFMRTLNSVAMLILVTDFKRVRIIFRLKQRLLLHLSDIRRQHIGCIAQLLPVILPLQYLASRIQHYCQDSQAPQRQQQLQQQIACCLIVHRR